MNLANKLTIFRIILVFIILIIPFFNIQGDILGIPITFFIIDVIFIIASITDKLDGYIARSRNQITTFGKFLDPIADKILVIISMMLLIEFGKIPSWIPAIIIMREFIVSGNIEVTAVDDISFEIKKGEIVVIVGASGAGKTTLLNILGGMDNLTYGQVIIDGKDISNYNDSQLTEYRRNDIGFVFEFYNLIQNLNAIENVELATQICTNTLNPEMVLEQVGLSNRIKNFPSQLSGGEQQRVAIARAIAKNPKILLCDEPTGALDYKTGKEVLKLLQDTANKNNMTVIIITHNQAIAPMANRVIKMKSGKIEENIINEKPVAIEEVEW